MIWSSSIQFGFLLFLFGVIILLSCEGNKNNNRGFFPFTEEIKLKQYKVQGELLYKQHCANCHQMDGSGLGRLIPPLSNNYHIQQGQEKISCILKYGMDGSVIIGNVEYNGKMPANYKLTNLEMAEILTFIGNSWNNSIGIVLANEIEVALQKCN